MDLSISNMQHELAQMKKQLDGMRQMQQRCRELEAVAKTFLSAVRFDDGKGHTIGVSSWPKLEAAAHAAHAILHFEG